MPSGAHFAIYGDYPAKIHNPTGAARAEPSVAWYLVCRATSIRDNNTAIDAVGRGGDNMRIVVDLNRCQGLAQCVPLAPDVLRLSGEEALQYDPNPDDSQRQRVLRAAAACPVQAIIVERLDEPGVTRKP
jgi:ferredoxin